MFPRNWGGKRRFPLYCLIAWHCVELGSGRAFIALSRRTLDYSHNAFRLTRKNRQRHGRPAGKTVSFRPFRGSPRFSAAVAQWIEYWPPKPRVVGSIPASRATSFPPSSRQQSIFCDPISNANCNSCNEFRWETSCAFYAFAALRNIKYAGPVLLREQRSFICKPLVLHERV